MIFLKYGVIAFTALVMLSGCTPKMAHVTPPPIAKPPKLLPIPVDNKPVCDFIKPYDVDYYPQNIATYVNLNASEQINKYAVQQEFDQHYYKPWSYQFAPISTKSASWPITAFKGGFGANLQRLDPSWFTQMEKQSNFQAYSTINRYGITTRWMSMRVFPTNEPLYSNPSRAGGGYPFDLLQNSSVAFNEPVFISHTSLDGTWSYVFSNNASGWVESSGVALIDPQTIALFKSKKKLFITDDKVPLLSSDQELMTLSRIGMVLPLLEETSSGYKALCVDSGGNVKELLVPKASAHVGIDLINKKTLIQLGNNLLNTTYGWGGMFQERDCSSTIRDFAIPFGIFLPRNSKEQAKRGEVFSFKGLRNDQKIALIKEKGVPFETILYKKGHVLLYIGTYEDKVMVLHNIWGVRTRDAKGVAGRAVIGKTIISTLELGKEVENFDPKGMLLSTLVSMNIFTKSRVGAISFSGELN